MTTMRVAQISGAGRPFEIVERPIPEPSPGTVRIKVAACGVCHSDALVKEGLWPGIQYPRVPGHEVTGTIDAVGAGVIGWTRGQRVGVGWNGGYCGRCDPCRRGNLFACETHQVTGISFDGGYGEYMIAPVSAVARFPDELSPSAAAPLMCAGLTTFNALRNSGARPGDVVAVLGLGGLGHLGVQYAAKMGFKVVGIAAARTKSRSPGSWVHQSMSTVSRKILPRLLKPRRRKRRHRDSHRRRGDERGRRWTGRERNIARGRRAGVIGIVAGGFDIRSAFGERLVLRHVDRLGGHARFQRANRRAVHERDVSIRTRE